MLKYLVCQKAIKPYLEKILSVQINLPESDPLFKNPAVIITNVLQFYLYNNNILLVKPFYRWMEAEMLKQWVKVDF